MACPGHVGTGDQTSSKLDVPRILFEHLPVTLETLVSVHMLQAATTLQD